MQITLLGGRLLVWVGKTKHRPITYDALVDAETRCFLAEEEKASLEEKLGMGQKNA